MKKKFLNIIKSIGIILGFVLLLNIFYILFALLIKNNVLSEIISSLICISIFTLIYKDEIISNFKEMKWFHNFKNYIGYYFLAYFIMLIANLIIVLIVGNIPTNEDLVRESIMNSVVLQSIYVVLIGPVYEEFLFRLNFRKTITNNCLFVIITGILFGSLHLLSAKSIIECLYVIPYCIMGMMLSFVYVKSNNIFTSIMIHSFNNLLTLIIMFLGVQA